MDSKPAIGAIAPFFIVRNVPVSIRFYTQQLGFTCTFEGPEPNDIFFGIVERDAAMIMLKDIGVEPTPNYSRGTTYGIARWDAYLHVYDPETLYDEFVARGIEIFSPLQTNDDGLRGFEVKDADGYMLYFGRPV